jgi:hypothetical protein
MLLLAAGAVDSFQLTEQEPGGIRIWGVCVTIRQVTTLREILQDPQQQQQKRKRSARARAPSNKKRAQPSVIRNLSDYHRSIPFRIYSMEWKQLTTPACCVYNAQQQHSSNSRLLSSIELALGTSLFFLLCRPLLYTPAPMSLLFFPPFYIIRLQCCI